MFTNVSLRGGTSIASFLALTIILVITLSGCSNEMEIDRINFPVALGIDFDETNNKIKIYAQVSVASSNTSFQTTQSTEKKFKVLEGQGDTLLDAMENAVDKGLQHISWKHVMVVVFTTKMAKHGIQNELDLLWRISQVHVNGKLMITDDNLKELLESKPKIESSMPTALAGIDLISRQSTDTKPITIKDFTMAYLSDGMAPILPRVFMIKGENKEIDIDYVGLGVFKNDKLIGNLSADETRGAISIFGMKTNGSFTIPYSRNSKDNKITIRSVTTRPEIIPMLQKNNLSITIKLDTEYKIRQISMSKKMDTAEEEKINKLVESYIKKNAEATVYKVQKKFHSDIFGFGEKVYRKYPEYWNKNKRNWNNIFPNVAINVEVKADLKNTGELLNSIEYSKD